MRLTAGLGVHTVTLGPHGCTSRAAKSGATPPSHGEAQTAVVAEAPTPTRIEEAGIRPVLGLGEKSSLSEKDTAAYCDRLEELAASCTCAPGRAKCQRTVRAQPGDV